MVSLNITTRSMDWLCINNYDWNGNRDRGNGSCHEST